MNLMRAESWKRICICCVLVVGLSTQNVTLAQTSKDSSSKDADCSRTFEERGFKKDDGLFTVYSKSNDDIFLEIGKDDFAREYIFANYVERGVGPIVGEYASPILIRFKKNGENIDIVQSDSVLFFDDLDPLQRTRQLTMSDTILASLKLHTCSSTDLLFAKVDQAALSSLSKSFFTNIGRRLHGGQFKWEKANLKGWQVFSDNMSFITEHNASSGQPLAGIANRTNFTVRIRHMLLSRSDPNFVPRIADSRVGYFGVARKNLGDIDQATFDTYIHRWKLEKKDPGAELSEPVKPIVFWIENTTPTKLKPYIRLGVLAWNEAFRSAGFINAIEVYDQPDDADWEAGDISKNVIRWQAPLDVRGAIGFGPAVHDPVTGQILGADILMTFGGLGNYVDDWKRLADGVLPATQGSPVSRNFDDNFAASKPSSSKIANDMLIGDNAPSRTLNDLHNFATIIDESRAKNGANPSLRSKIQSQTSLPDESREATLINAENKNDVPLNEELSFADRMIKEVVIGLIMHEVGHTLGLEHNFRGSHWHSIDEIFDREITKGAISASVMDYLPINLAPMNSEQGDFANTRVGPYDIWAIEFGYKPELEDPIKGEQARSALLQRAGAPGLLFGGFGTVNNDPHTLPNDLTRDPIDYAALRIDLIATASQRATESENFDSPLQFIGLYNELSSQLFFALNTIIAQINPYAIGASRSEEADAGSILVYGVNPKRNQKEAVDTLNQLIFASDTYGVSPEFFFRMGADASIIDIVSRERLLTKNIVLHSLINDELLLRMHHASEYGGDYSPTELLFDLKRAIFGRDLNPQAKPTKERRDQQILFARKLVDIITSPKSTRGRSGLLLGHSEQSIVSAAARPVLNELRRDLFLRTPWLPMEIRGHRQELRAILKATD